MFKFLYLFIALSHTSPYALLFVCHALILVSQAFSRGHLAFPMCITQHFYVTYYLVLTACSWLSYLYLCGFSLPNMYCTITPTHTKLASHHHPAARVRRLRRHVAPIFNAAKESDIVKFPSRDHSRGCSCVTSHCDWHSAVAFPHHLEPSLQSTPT